MAPGEKTPLLRENFDSTVKLYNKKNRSYYTCLFASLGVLIFVAFVVAIWYIFELKSTNSNQNSENGGDLYILVNNEWPRPDAVSQLLPYGALITLINEAVDEGKQQLKVRQQKDENVAPLDSNSPTFKHQQSIVYSPVGSNLSDYGYVETEATKYLRDKGVHNVINYGSATELKWAKETDCNRYDQSIPCEATPYRSVSGTCNNLKNSQKWGVAMTPFRRALGTEYDDGVSVPRGGFETSLPSARDVSVNIHRPVYRTDDNFTVMLAVWGQFLDHDLTATALSRGINGTAITCCTNSKSQHPECFPVSLKPDDPYYSEFNLTCMEFVRSAPALRCSFGPREQLNQASSYIDASMIYGNTEDLAKRLRTFNNGELEMSYTREGRALLPVTTDPIDGCNQLEEIKKGRYCFLSGDTRANENTHLTSMHLILARQHNNISNQLRAFNPFWDDETLYQESRRIVTAQLQHITYNEFLPAILGEQLMDALKLYSTETGYWTKYNGSIEVTISNNFASASFRFAHTLIPRMMKTLANDTDSPEYVEMHKMLFNPFGLYDGELDSIIRGAFNTSLEKADNFFPKELTEKLFISSKTTKSSKSFGLDLVSLNIQRGRDHGLATYTKWREYCNLSSIHGYDDLHGIFDEESLKSISSLYKSVHDIDLYTGGLSEIPIPGGLLGPTFTCLIADQFYRLKHGDRFWYETNEKPQAFTPEQLDEIKKTTLAGIICQNADDLKMVTPAVMRSSKENNEHILCSQVPQPDLSVWRTNPEKRFGLNVIRLRIQYPERVFTWNNESDANISSQLPNSGRLTRIVTIKTSADRNNVVEMRGKFVFITENGTTVSGLFDLKAETSSYIDISNTRIKFPIYFADNNTDNSILNSSKIILHTIPVSSGKVVWTGSVTVDLIPLSWNNVSDSSKLNKTKENEQRSSENPSQKTAESSSSETTQSQPKDPSKINRDADENEKFPVPTKRDKNIGLAKDNEWLRKNATDGDQMLDANEFRSTEDLSPRTTDESPATSENTRPKGTDQSTTNRGSGENDTFSVPTKRAQNSDLKKDYEFFKKNSTAASEEEYYEEDEIYTTVPELAATNSSHEENILYHILETHPLKPSNVTTLEEDELRYLQELTPNSSIFLNNSPEIRHLDDQITQVNITAESMEISDNPAVSPPLQIPTSDLANGTVVWDVDSMDPLSGSFKLHHKNGTFKIKYNNQTKDDLLLHLNPACKYYSKITLEEPTNQSALFDMNLETAPNGCTVIAPLQLHGNMISPKTFSWDGNATIHVREPRTDFGKEDELVSLNVKRKRVLNLQPVTGNISSSVGHLWNGSLPLLLNASSTLGWSSSNHTIAYPVIWSGEYEDSNLVGNFEVLQKTSSSVETLEGKFSINLSSLNSVHDLIKPFSMHQSVVYLTEKSFYIHEIDVSEFDIIEDWDSSSVSSIILLGEFVQDGFVWSGNATIIVPQDAVTEKRSTSNTMLTYRPHGKYHAKIFDATLFAVLDNSPSVLKWWSGVLPSTLVIPATLPQMETYKKIFNKAILWSYEHSNDSEHATFKTYGNESKIHLFGDFEFEAKSLFDDIRTSALKPNVEYYSPLVLQGEVKTDTDLIIKLNDLRDPNAGAFAPIMLLGNYTTNGAFEWNLQCIIHVEDN